MSMFTLANSCLTTSNLPWFMDLTFQVPMQYCFLQHQILFPSPVTSTTGCCFCFGSGLFILSQVISSLFSSSIQAPTDPGNSSFSVLTFCLFILFMGSTRQEYWSGFPFPSPVDHILSELSPMTGQSGSGVEGQALIFSRENSKIATNHWTTIDRRKLDPTKKRYPMSKIREPQ